MKRIGILSLALLLLGGGAFAEDDVNDRVGHVDLGIEGGGASVDANGLDDSGWVQSNISYGVMPWLALGVSAGWTQTGNGADGDTGIAEVMGDIIVRWPNHPWDPRLVPYGVVGLGGMWTYAEVENAQDRNDSGFGWKIGAGLDWWFSSNWIINFEVAHHNSSDDLPVDHRPSNDDSIGFTTVTGGLKLVF